VKGRLVLGVLAVAAFLVLRIATLVTSFEAVSWDEELQRGAIAHELTRGPKASLWEYRADPYSGGSLVIGLLAAPLFYVFGPRLVVLKLVPLTISLLTLGLLIVLLDRYHSCRAAWAGALLFVLAPPFTTQLAFFAMGYHTESIVFSVLLVLASARALERPDGPGAFWFGLVAGAGFFFTYITAITALGCLFWWGPFARRSALGKLAIGLTLGIAPWAAYNLTHHFDGVRIAQVWLTLPAGAVDSPVQYLLRLGWRGARLLTLAVPLSYGFPAMLGVPGSVWSCAYLGLTLAPIVWLLLRARARHALARPLLAAAVVFLAVYPFTRFAVPTGASPEEYRHFLPLQFALLTVVAMALAEAPGGRAASWALIALGAMGQATLLGRNPAPHLLDYRGYSYAALGSAWSDRIDPIVPQASTLLAGFDPSRARLIYWGAVSSAPWRTTETMASRIHEVPDDYRRHFAEAVGRSVGMRRTDFTPLLAAIDAVPPDVREPFVLGYVVDLRARSDVVLPDVAPLRRLPPPLQRWCHFGIGRLLHDGCVDARDAGTCRALVDGLERGDPAAVTWIYRGAGAAAAPRWSIDLRVDTARIGSAVVPPSHRLDFAWGLGWGIRDAFKEDLVRTRDWAARLGSGERAAALEGVSAYDAFYRLRADPGAGGGESNRHVHAEVPGVRLAPGQDREVSVSAPHGDLPVVPAVEGDTGAQVEEVDEALAGRQRDGSLAAVTRQRRPVASIPVRESDAHGR
jgi:hypothetical protein